MPAAGADFEPHAFIELHQVPIRHGAHLPYGVNCPSSPLLGDLSIFPVWHDHCYLVVKGEIYASLEGRWNIVSSQFQLSIPMTRAWAIVSDLRVRKLWLYWVDFLCSVLVGWGAFAIALSLPAPSLRCGFFFIVAGLALYRAVIFTHELAHAPLNVLRGFRTVWNLLCGYALLVPSFIYRGVHRDHHRRDLYGREEDGEYLPFGIESPYKILLYVLLPVVLPACFVARFLVLVPLSYLRRDIRRFTWVHASSLAIDLTYRRPLPSAEEERIWLRQELAAFVYAAGAIVLVALQVLPYEALVLWYATTAFILFVNSLRTLAAHRYRSRGDQSMEIGEQFLDSVDVPGHLVLSSLWAPVGLRYHATHHLFPALPYHALGAAHKRLSENLPDNTVYLAATRKSLWDALRRLWRDARDSQVAGAQVDTR